MNFIPNWQAKYKSKDDAILGILESFVNVPNAKGIDGFIIFTLGNNLLKIKPNKKKVYAKNTSES